MQAALEDVTGRPFEALAELLIFGPLGMRRSTFAQPLPEALHSQVATGQTPEGRPVEGRWHVYPEQAPAGLCYANKGKAAIIVCNGEAGSDLNIELLRAIATEYDWPKDRAYHWFWNDPPAEP